MDISTVITALSGAKAFAENCVEVRDAIKFQEHIIKYNQAIIDAQQLITVLQSENHSLVDRIRDLEHKEMQSKNEEGQFSEYHEVEVASGVFCLVGKAFVGNLEYAKKLCPQCADNGKKSMLNVENFGGV